MYTTFLVIHAVLRWIVLVAAVVAAGKGLVGWFGKQKWSKLDDRLGLILTIAIDGQLVVGLVLYVFLSPLTAAAFRDFGAAMRDSTLRFFAVEHFLLMVVAVVLAHMGRSLSKKASGDAAKFQRAGIFFALTLIAILAGTPWFRSLNPFHLLMGG
jgi:hypothetical protein